MTTYIQHKANERGKADFGWLKSFHSFSFGHYYNPKKVHFGALRVLNDDTVAPGMGFGAHPHDNMEIISIPLEGDLEHKDSMGNAAVIRKGDIQVMSAGTGIRHSEYNHSGDNEVKFLQIWIIPNRRNVTPRYDQISLDPAERHNKLQQILSPNQTDEGVWIHQDAWFHLGTFDKNFVSNYSIQNKPNGIYAFVLKGSFDIDGQEVSQRDALAIESADSIQLTSKEEGSEILIMEVPMEL